MKSFILLVFILMTGCQQNQNEENEKREPQTPTGKYVDSLFVVMNDSLDSMKSWVQELIDALNAGGELDTLKLKRISDAADSVIAMKFLAMDSLPNRYGMAFESWYRRMVELDTYFMLIGSKVFWYNENPNDSTKARLMRTLRAAKDAKESLEHHITQGDLRAPGRIALKIINEDLQRMIDSLAVDCLNPQQIKSISSLHFLKLLATIYAPRVLGVYLQDWYYFLNALDEQLEATKRFAYAAKLPSSTSSRDDLIRHLGHLKKIIEIAKSMKGELELKVKNSG